MDSARYAAPTDGFLDHDRIDVRDVLGVLRGRLRWVIGAPLVLAALVGLYAVVSRPTYTATAQVFVDPRERHTPKDDPMQNAVPGDGLLLVESQLKIITSDEVLNRVIDKTGLDSDPEFNGERAGLVGTLKRIVGLGEPADRRLAALRNLRLKTAAKRIDRSFVIDIMASADTRERATALANALAAAYLEEQAGADSAFNRQLSETLARQLEKLRLAVTRSEESVVAYKEQNGLIGSRSRLVTEQQLDEANTQLTAARTRLAEAQARVRLVDSVRNGGASLDALPEAIQSATIVQLRARAADISREETRLALTEGPRHPDLLASQAQKRDIEAAIARELSRVAQALRNAAASEKANVQALQAEFDSLKALSQTNEKRLVPLRELERTAEANRATYETFLAKAKTAEQQQGIDKTNIRMISRATPPESKSWPPTIVMLGAALIGGLAIGVALALARDYIARRGETLPAASPESQLRQLVDDLRDAPAGHTVLFLRAAATPLLDLMPLKLALELERDGDDVLLVDADLEKRGVTTRLRLDRQPGLTDVMRGKYSIHRTARLLEELNLSVLPAGRAAPAPTGDAARRALGRMLDEARDFDLIIVEGGELGDIPSRLGLSALADEVVILAPERGVREADVARTVEALRREGQSVRAMFVKTPLEKAA